MLAAFSYARLRRQNRTMGEDLEQLKQRLPLLDYLRQVNWSGRPTGQGAEFVGLCPLHPETRPSFYVNGRKNLFYCHGCGQGGDLIRFVELSLHLSFPQSLAYLQQQGVPAGAADAREQAAVFYQQQFPLHPEALRYLEQRGVHDPTLIEELRIGYAPGGNLRRHLTNQGHSLELLQRDGLVNPQGGDAFYRRVVLPCCQEGQVANLYGRSIGTDFPHRFLPGPKGGLFAWESVRQFSSVMLVEGLLDLAVLWQAGFRNTTCAFGTHLTPFQFQQLSEQPDRVVYIVFDQDENQAGQRTAHHLARRLAGASVPACLVQLPAGHDPNSYFVAGAAAADFAGCLEGAHSL
jgi:DNA primase catalytic core